jgi:16S rRNA (cytidine1402-2'-O)-methyltransferase
MTATPIGNLGDLSDRALRTLEEADEIWCEDTRHTQALLNAVSIDKKRLKRVDQHTEGAVLRPMLKRVEEEGLRVAVVTDAGTPGLSDPGALIMTLSVEYPGIRFEPIPGPSAVTAMVSLGGFDGNSYSFHGFFPRSESEGLELLNELKNSNLSLNHIFFESPNRIADTLKVFQMFCEATEIKPKFVFAKELTKIHETVFAGQGLDFLQWLQAQGFDERGEWVLALTLPRDCLKNKKDTSDWELALDCLLEAGISAKTASQLIVGRFSVAKNLAYKTALEKQKK